MLKQLETLFNVGKLSYRQRKIPIVRIDLAKTPKILESEDLAHTLTPQIFVYINNHFYQYTEKFQIDFFVLFLNRHLFPVVLLKTFEDVEKFRDVTKDWTENTPFYRNGTKSFNPGFDTMSKVTRVIAFVSDKSEYKDELENLNKQALILARRDDLRVAKITNPEIVKKFKTKFGRDWFGDFKSDAILLFKKGDEKTNLRKYDLSTDTKNLYIWLNEESLEKFDEITGTSFKIMEFLNKPMLVAYMDRQHAIYGKESRRLYEMLKRIANDYTKILISFSEIDQYRSQKIQMGITWNEEPAIGVHNISNKGIPIYPRNVPFTDANLRAFIEACLKGIVDSSEIDFPDENNEEEIKEDL